MHRNDLPARLAGATLAFLAATAPALAQLRDENLLTALPQGFKLGYQASQGNEDMAEYVPAGETVDDWSEMVTVQVFHGLGGVDLDGFAQRLATGWSNACPGGEGQRVGGATDNGYRFALWSYTCPLNPETGKPETMRLKIMSGKDALYSVQFAYRAKPSDDEDTRSGGALDKVGVCDTRSPDHPCPPRM